MIVRQRLEEFKNVPAGQTQLDIFHILLFKHVQLPIQVNPTEELHCADPFAHVAPNDNVLLKIIVPNFSSNDFKRKTSRKTHKYY